MTTTTWWAWRGKNGFSHDLVEYLIEEGKKQETSNALLLPSSDPENGQQEKPEIRRSQIAWLNHIPEIRDSLFNFVIEANRKAFCFDVQNAADVQFTEYHASEKGHYDWHEDWDPFDGRPYQRKLSITVQLSDPDEYEGGDFELSRIELPDWRKEKGTILIFPSFLSHRVTPVTEGVRRSLVAWFEGPSWR